MYTITLTVFTLLSLTLSLTLTLTLSVDPTCETGILTSTTCCPRSCGICGGPDCGARSRAAKSLCCKTAIQRSSRDCRTAAPPCVVTITPPDPTCSTGLLKRTACCPKECGTCGGDGCAARGRLIGSHCCVGGILNRMDSCDLTGPPCVVNKNDIDPIPDMNIPPTPDAEITPEPNALPQICDQKILTRKCFCYVVLKRVINVRKRYKFVRICVDMYGRRAINKMAQECNTFVDGADKEMNVSNLVLEVNTLIPMCYPPDTPFVKFRS